MLRACSLGSGRVGNALVVEARDGLAVTLVLVDNGFNLRQLGRRLERAGLALHDFDAVLVTHEHSDHVGGVARDACKAGLPVYCSEGTARAAGLVDLGVEWRELASGVRQALGAPRARAWTGIARSSAVQWTTLSCVLFFWARRLLDIGEV